MESAALAGKREGCWVCIPEDIPSLWGKTGISPWEIPERPGCGTAISLLPGMAVEDPVLKFKNGAVPEGGPPDSWAGDEVGVDNCDRTESSGLTICGGCDALTSDTTSSNEAQLLSLGEAAGCAKAWLGGGACDTATAGGSGSASKSIKLAELCHLTSAAFPLVDPKLLEDAVLYNKKKWYDEKQEIQYKFKPKI